MLDPNQRLQTQTNRQVLFESEDEEAQDKLMWKLCPQLHKEFIGHFGAPLGRRIAEILPFLVFVPQQSAVMVHKVLMDLETLSPQGSTNVGARHDYPSLLIDLPGVARVSAAAGEGRGGIYKDKGKGSHSDEEHSFRRRYAKWRPATLPD
ncbi:hypothetical protein DL771_006757 [Monosporascus sp. 5C6A]|nr:hypothetical protein DL771_006757 [Monosporascus sp. 5C6A]